MPSPFPGMNPYLESHRAWHPFHVLFPGEAMRQLNRQIGPRYYVDVDQHVYIHEGTADECVVGRPDAYVAEAHDHLPTTGQTASVLDPVAASETVRLADVDELREPFVEIRDAESNEVVTVIELRSPSNKVGGDREKYLDKRNDVLTSRANLVEIDLLRGGRRMPLAKPAKGDYGVLVSRPQDRPEARWHSFALRDRLLPIPIPLREGDPPVLLDLQAIVHAAHDDGLAKFMYRTSPDPPLAAEDAAWARDILAGAGITAAVPSP